jgi:hypothetical protein
MSYDVNVFYRFTANNFCSITILFKNNTIIVNPKEKDAAITAGILFLVT